MLNGFGVHLSGKGGTWAIYDIFRAYVDDWLVSVVTPLGFPPAFRLYWDFHRSIHGEARPWPFSNHASQFQEKP